MLNRIVIRLISVILIFVCMGIGFKAGYAGVFAAYRLIAPKIALAIREMPTLFVATYAILATLLTVFAVFSLYRIGLLNAGPVSGKQIANTSFVSIAFGLTSGLIYWIVLQILLIVLQMLR